MAPHTARRNRSSNLESRSSFSPGSEPIFCSRYTARKSANANHSATVVRCAGNVDTLNRQARALRLAGPESIESNFTSPRSGSLLPQIQSVLLYLGCVEPELGRSKGGISINLTFARIVSKR